MEGLDAKGEEKKSSFGEGKADRPRNDPMRQSISSALTGKPKGASQKKNIAAVNQGLKKGQ